MRDKYDVEATIIPEEDEKEIWVPAPGFEDRYDISSFGNLRYRATGRLRKIVQDHNGYPAVNLKIDGKVYFVYIHRLVCEAFYGKPTPDKNVCDHIDRCIINNYYKNLHWTDYYGNSINHREKQRYNITVGKTPVIFFNNQGQYQQRFDNIIQAHEVLGISIQQIQLNLRGRRSPFKNGYFRTESEYLTSVEK